MSYSLSSIEKEQYRRDGFVVRESVFDDDELVRLSIATEEAVARAWALSQQGETYILDGKRFVDVDYLTVQFEPTPGSETIKVVEPAHQLHADLDTLVDDPRITMPMRDIIDCDDLSLWTAKLNLKRPGEGSGFGWHQDSPYWVHDCGHVDLLPNVMVTLDDATESNGCFRVIRGSHTRGCLPGTADGTQLGGFYTDPNAFDESQQIAIVAPAGSLIFFNAHSVHGSRPNESDDPRRAFILTYQPGGFPTLKSREIRQIQG